ncbi:LTA synthase family protein [Herbivorax sp. ANBcel31]|uniref:LTA synthase family protein n=1 Tax=Herbivorax sp. ANBcel31 TaxID=3069754 RepID=UPI0027B3F130|nr:LTA synthase family protein [Herbivorax sp. ANBcel31]MDQ2086967.1 LTA synthase family protein [Herbivorax sp. ANBcel31]
MKRLYINKHYLNILLIVAFSFILSIVGVQISSVFSLEIVWRFVKSPILLIMNTLPITLFMLFVFFISSRLWASFFFGGTPFLIFHFINRFKIRLRHEPFVPADIYLGNESTKVINLSQLPFDRNLYVLLAVFVLFSLFLFLYVKSKKMNLLFRGSGILLTVLFSVLLYFTSYSSTSFYNKFEIYGSQYSQVDVVNSRGFIYSFLIKTHTFNLPVPEGYSAVDCENILSQYDITDDDDIELPHIIGIMSEAFWDIDKVSAIEFNSGYDPLENFNRIIDQSYSGTIVTNVFGGGTADTEFSLLTGHTRSTLNDFANPYINFIRRNTYALPWILEEKGYKTTGFHPGFPWFYNRFNVYDYLGFQNTFFIDDMENIDRATTYYVSDMDAFDFLMDDFYSHLDNYPDSPYFNFTVTIENHGPYPNYDMGNPEIIKRGSVDNEYYHLINNFTNGLMSCDKALDYLVQQLEQIDEPVVLLYFSDHLPLLGENFSGFKAMDYSIGTSGDLESYLNTYETPYFIWSNTSAKDLLTEQGKTPVIGEAPYISTHYLPVELFDYIGLNTPNYFNYLRELRDDFPVMTSRFYQLGDGTFTEDLDENELDIISEYRNLQYYMLFDKDIKSSR